MNKKICQFLSLFSISLFVLVSPAYASVLYFTPVGGTMTVGQTFQVQVHLKTTDPEKVTSTSIYFTYPNDRVDIVSVKPGAAFPTNLGNSYSNGTFAMTRNSSTGVSGDVVVATIGFKPKFLTDPIYLNFIDGIMASQADGTDTLDATWTKSDVAQFDVKEATKGATTKSQGGQDILPVAGLEDNTFMLLGLGGGLVFLSGVGFVRTKKLKMNKIV